MTDIVDKETRSRMMSNIRGKDTSPEILVRKLLHSQGFRFRLHGRSIPGRPDLVLARYKALIQVQGCFWHGHNCHLFKLPSTRREFWETKIASNKDRDRNNLEQCQSLGWKTLVVWECALKGKTRLGVDELASAMRNWIQSDCHNAEITGKQVTPAPE